MRKLLLVGCAALVLGGSAAAVSSQPPRNETFRLLELLGDVVEIVEQADVVPGYNKKLNEAALSGMTVASQTPRNETFRMLQLFGDVLGVVEPAYVVPVVSK